MLFGNDSQREVNRNHNDLEPQQVFMDKMAAKREKLSEKKFEVPVKEGRLWSLFAFFLLVMLLFLGRTFNFQILQHDDFFALAEDNKEINELIVPKRGVIYDQDRKQLVSNIGSFDLVLHKRRLPDVGISRAKMMEKIASVVDKKTEEVRKEVEKSEFGQVLVGKNLSHEQLISAKTKLGDKPGIEIVENAARDYKYGELFAHVIGYTGKISQEELSNSKNYSPTSYVGKSGLEKFYEEVLRGEPGVKRIKKDARGNFLSEEVVSEPHPGKSLVLGIDKELQEKSTQALHRILEKYGIKKGVVIASDPRDGTIRALVSLPTFNTNLFSQGITRKQYQRIKKTPGGPMFNKATAGVFPTGSIIKPLEAAGGLEEEVITPNTTINCKGKIEVKNKYTGEMRAFRDWTTHGITDVRKAIAESCNVFFYSVGGGHGKIEGMGAEKVKEWVRKFGWGQKTGIDLPDESKGTLPGFGSNWTLGDTYHFSIGQGPIAIPPVQVMSSFAAVANGGTLYHPRIVTEIIDNNENEFRKTKPEVIRKNIASEQNLKVVREGMKQAVTSPEGSSHVLNDLPVTAAAKTGTAQTGEKNHHHDWIGVFAPYEEPEIVLTVLIVNDEGEHMTATLVAKEILNSYFQKEETEE